MIRLRIPLVVSVLSVLLPACEHPVMAGEREEIPTAESAVPVEIQLAAAKLCARMGRASTRDWVWDAEDSNWEVAVDGLTRQAELDILPDGTFSELELVYSFSEVQRSLPDVAEQIRARCGERNVRIELSLRRVEHLDLLPELAAAWKLDGVVLEFQGEGRGDYELDARGLVLTHPVDDQE